MMILSCIVTLGLMSENHLGIQSVTSSPPYTTKLFDPQVVHTIDIELEDQNAFFASAQDENYVMSTLTIDGEKYEGVGLRVKGNNSLRLIDRYDLNRYSLKVEFDHYDNTLNYYGLDKFSLDCSFQDNAYLKNFMTYDMMKFMGVPTPLCSYVWVTINQEDWGLFLAIEEPEESFAKRCFGHDYGQLYKPSYKSLDDANEDIALKYIGDDPILYDNIFRNAKFDPTKEDKQRVIEALKVLDSKIELESAIDVDEVLRYFVVQVFVVNLDSYLGQTGHNYFLYEEDGILQILPWDYNLAYGTYALGKPEPSNDTTMFVNYPINTPNTGDIMTNRPLFHNIMQNPIFYQEYHSYFDHFISEYFESGYFEQKVKEMTDLINPYIKKDPTAFCNYEDHLLGVEAFKEFCLLRAQSVRGQLEGTIPSTFQMQETNTHHIDASHLALEDMGEIADLYE